MITSLLIIGIIVSYVFIGILFTIITNKITPLDSIEGIFFWPIMILILFIFCGEIVFKKLLDFLGIPNDINPNLYED